MNMYPPGLPQPMQIQRPPSYVPDPKFNQTLQTSIIHQMPQEPQMPFETPPSSQIPPIYEQQRHNSCFSPPADPAIIVVEKRYPICYRCGDENPGFMRKTPGCVTLTWAVALAIFGTWMCCVPFFVDGCLDKEEVCTKCGTVRNTTKANCL